MDNDTHAADPVIEEVRQRLEDWRKIKKHRQPIPKDIWQDAAGLARKHSINTVSKTLRLSYTDLKDRVCGPSKTKQKSSDFIEIGYGRPSLVPETTIEMENKKGSRLKVSLKGGTDSDLMDLARTFLQKNL
jgi:hypothetical protein